MISIDPDRVITWAGEGRAGVVIDGAHRDWPGTVPVGQPPRRAGVLQIARAGQRRLWQLHVTFGGDIAATSIVAPGRQWVTAARTLPTMAVIFGQRWPAHLDGWRDVVDLTQDPAATWTIVDVQWCGDAQQQLTRPNHHAAVGAFGA